jgi:HAD superfamily hydrolase (TIGR01549 family)
MNQTILMDFWGTLIQNGVWSPTKQVQNILRIDLPFPQFVVRMEKAMMTQPFESLTNAFNSVGTEFRLRVTDEEMDELIGMWNKNWMLAKPFPEVVAALTKLSEKYNLVLISNTEGKSVNNVLEKFHLKDYFKDIFFSCDLGKIKTNPEFLNAVLTKLNITKEDCMLVGDSLESDIKPAEGAGIKAILIDRKNRRDYSNKIASLTEL